MADYKQIKTLTIDGVTQGMEEGLGITDLSSNIRTGAVTAGEEYSGVSHQITKAGAYIVFAEIYFPAAMTTGVTSHRLALYDSSGTRFGECIQIDGTNGVARLSLTVVFNATTVPVTLTTKFSCSKAIAANAGLQTQIRVSKIVRIPTT